MKFNNTWKVFLKQKHSLDKLNIKKNIIISIIEKKSFKFQHLSVIKNNNNNNLILSNGGECLQPDRGYPRKISI